MAESDIATVSVIDPLFVEKIIISSMADTVHADSQMIMMASVLPKDASIKFVNWSVVNGIPHPDK